MIPLLALNGPTASGKSGLAIDVALTLAGAGLPAEIVNADSMLVYRGMDIGTAKPSPEERRGVPHHLVDILDITQSATVADFQRRARAAFTDIRGRGAVPIVVGGSALYMRAILDHFEFPATDADVRARWESELARIGAPALHAVLATRSPEAARELEPGNGRRIVRALEVLDHGLTLDRALMDARIEARVDQMWADGLVAEVEALAARGLRDGFTAAKALGYRQVLAHLDGEITEQEARAETARRTRRFARKQLSWFRRDHRITWHDASDPDLAARLAEVVLSGCQRGVEDWGNG